MLFDVYQCRLRLIIINNGQKHIFNCPPRLTIIPEVMDHYILHHRASYYYIMRGFYGKRKRSISRRKECIAVI